MLLSAFLSMQVFDAEDASITDEALINFLSASGPWLQQVQAVDLKHCHYTTKGLLAFLRTACPKLRKLAPSRWAEHTAMAEISQFPALEVGQGEGRRASQQTTAVARAGGCRHTLSASNGLHGFAACSAAHQGSYYCSMRQAVVIMPS